MVDVVDPATRSKMMSNIRGRDTKPEMRVRRALHRAGFRFRLHVPLMPGRPDIVLPRYRVAIFVHGCFWHRHEGCRFSTTPATRTGFWNDKFASNVERDAKHTASLVASGWRVATIWECALKKPKDSEPWLSTLIDWLTEDCVDEGRRTLDIGTESTNT